MYRRPFANRLIRAGNAPWLVLAIALMVACHRPPTDTHPYFPAKGTDWAPRNPAQVGMNADKLAEAVAFAKTQETTQMAPDFSTQPGGRSRRNLR